MKKKTLDISSLEKAVASLETAVKSYESNKGSLPLQERDLLRDGTIQRFEYTFELCWKMIKRYLEMYGLEKIDKTTNRELFRIANENGLLRDVESWFGYLDDRNQTSHIYDQEIAEDVFSSIEGFLRNAQFVLDQLRNRIK
jgi:nucleotidyltransferase substrate binding protein (TIGR01987 family)